MPPYSVRSKSRPVLFTEKLTPSTKRGFTSKCYFELAVQMPKQNSSQSQLYVVEPPLHIPKLNSQKTKQQREWESSVTLQHPKITTHQLLGRIRNLDVELFSPFPKLRSELEALDYTVRELDSSKSMSIYADIKFSERSLVQKLQDQLYDALRVDGEEVAYGIIAATQNEWMLVCKLDRVSEKD
jgi:hypothetical protein